MLQQGASAVTAPTAADGDLLAVPAAASGRSWLASRPSVIHYEHGSRPCQACLCIFKTNPGWADRDSWVRLGLMRRPLSPDASIHPLTNGPTIASNALLRSACQPPPPAPRYTPVSASPLPLPSPSYMHIHAHEYGQARGHHVVQL